MKLEVGIILKSREEIVLMRQAGRITAAVLDTLARKVRPGMKTRELDVIASQEMRKYGAGSAFKGYRGYPAHICVSVQDELVHGIPGERVLAEGEIVSLDVGVIHQGFVGDAALTVGVGEISPQAHRLLAVTSGALEEGIQAARAGAHLGDISVAIQRYVEDAGFSVIREYTGHGVGRELHEDPLVPNFGLPGQGPVLAPGMTLALEPMVSAGGWRTRVAPNHWTVHTLDGSLSAHFEHTIAVTNGQAEVLTIL